MSVKVVFWFWLSGYNFRLSPPYRAPLLPLASSGIPKFRECLKHCLSFWFYVIDEVNTFLLKLFMFSTITIPNCISFLFCWHSPYLRQENRWKLNFDEIYFISLYDAFISEMLNCTITPSRFLVNCCNFSTLIPQVLIWYKIAFNEMSCQH